MSGALHYQMLAYDQLPRATAQKASRTEVADSYSERSVVQGLEGGKD